MTSRGFTKHLPEIMSLYSHVGKMPFYVDEVDHIITEYSLIQKLAGRGYLTHTGKTKLHRSKENSIIKQWQFNSNGIRYINYGNGSE